MIRPRASTRCRRDRGAPGGPATICQEVVAVRGILLLTFLLPLGIAEERSQLGEVNFPTSGSPAAQAHFLRGVAALHSFWFDEALEAFRAATAAEPDFMMGYWGEAMAHNHPLWGEQDTDAARKVLARVGPSEKLTPRERAYLDAVAALYGPGDKLARDVAYAAAMERVHRRYPDDLEAACFYALALLGTVRPGDRGFLLQMQAGALALDVFARTPNHPGAAHYIIHAFDDPEHAILALPAARRYAEIAPEAHHARHMPAHIFVQLGMWPEAAASNESAWAASVAWVERKKLPLGKRDYHSLSWLEYVYLQQGRFRQADEVFAQKCKDMDAARGDGDVGRGLQEMAARLVLETGRLNRVEALFGSQAAGGASPPSGATGEHAAHAIGEARNDAVSLHARGLAAALSNRPADADTCVAGLRELRGKLAGTTEPYRARIIEIRELQVAGAAAAARGTLPEAMGLLRRATALEEEMSPPSGPPELIKPSHELFGEVLLRGGRPE